MSDNTTKTGHITVSDPVYTNLLDNKTKDSTFIQLQDEITLYRKIINKLDISMVDGWMEMNEANREGRAYHINLNKNCYIYRENISSRYKIVIDTDSCVGKLICLDEGNISKSSNYSDIEIDQKNKLKNDNILIEDEKIINEDTTIDDDKIQNINILFKSLQDSNNTTNTCDNFNTSEDILKWFAVVPNISMLHAQSYFSSALQYSIQLWCIRKKLESLLNILENSI